MEVYSFDSFDRFGDDLTELILSYLTFEDKVRLECVSKQWRRLVFNKQFVIEMVNERNYIRQNRTINSLNQLYRRIDGRIQLNEQSIESVLLKCLNIRKVIVMGEVDSSVLSLIGRYCPNIKSLSLKSYHLQCLDFFLKYGHKLEELIFYDDIEKIKKCLEFCPNLKKLKTNYRFP